VHFIPQFAKAGRVTMPIKPTITFRKLEMVEAVARLGSLRAAADRLNLTQPALTQGLKSIEGELGVTLFIRSPRGLEPTLYVDPIISHTLGIRAEMQAVKRELKLKEAMPKETISFQCGPRSRHLWVDAAIAAMQAAGEPISINLIEDTPNLYENLRAGRVDLALVPADIIPKQTMLILMPFTSIKNLLVCREGHPLTHMSEPSLDDIFQFPLAGDVISPRYLTLFAKGIGTFVKSSPSGETLEPAIFAATLNELREIVVNSDALAVMPLDVLHKGEDDPAIIPLYHQPIDLPDLPVAIAFHKNRNGNPTIFRFIDYLRDVEFERNGFFS
jgi:DNA-binding transcriptional LysR family regulator